MSANPRRRIPSEKEFDTLLRDSAFVDYFNVYLNQPVFGQRVTYRQRTDDFILDPPVQKRRYKVFDSEVKDWLRTHRFPAFVQSDLFVEYNLCCRLRDTKDGFLHNKSGDLQSNNEFWEKTTEFLIGQVLGMQYFRHSLSNTTGDIIFACWMDLERFRRLPVNNKQRKEMYQQLKEKYIVNGAPQELTRLAKHQAFKGLVDFSLIHDEICADGPDLLRFLVTSHIEGSEEVNASTPETFIRLQYVMLTALKSYWLPRYIIRVVRTISNDKFSEYCHASVQEEKDEFFAGKTRMRLQSLFPDTLADQEASLSVTPESPITDQKEGGSTDEGSDPVTPSDLFSLWGGQKFPEANLFPTYEDLTSGRLSDTSSKAHGGSLWTPPAIDSKPPSPIPLSPESQQPEDSSDSSSLDHTELHTQNRRYRRINRKQGKLTEQSNHDLSLAVKRLIRGPLFTKCSKYEEENIRLVCAIASDNLAGKPLEEHLIQSCSFSALMYLILWNDLREYINVDPHSTDSLGRSRRQLFGVGILRRYFLTPTATALLQLENEELGNKFHTCLMNGKLDDVLITAQEQCCQALKDAWHEFISSDRHGFVHKVIRRGKTLNKGAAFAEKEVLACQNVDFKNMWKAMEIAVVSRLPQGLNAELTIEELAMLNDLGFGSLSTSKPEPVYNPRLRQMICPEKLDIETLRVNRESLYTRPEIPTVRFSGQKGFHLRRNGEVIDRPPKPRYFPECLTNLIHFEFFKRFLVSKRAATPLLFWKHVQELKETKNPRQRVSKVSQIFRRYFSKNAQYGAQLDCPDEIIKQITQMERVTASMIVCAQGAVMRSMERKWFRAYLDTFPEDDTRSPVTSPAPGDSAQLYEDFELDWVAKKPPTKLHTYALWVKCLRVITHFISCLKDQRRATIFWLYLKLQVKRATQKKASNTSEVKIVLQNRLLVVNKLPQDLLYWVEVSKYTRMLDDACKPGLLFHISKMDEENLRVKATAIVNCFLCSEIQPKLQINVTPEAAASIITVLGNRGPTRSIFHESIMSIFPVLFHYFKNCCDEWGILRKKLDLENMYAEKIIEVKGSQRFSSPHSSVVFPTYTDVRPDQMKRVMGARGDECVRINFTIHGGVRIIIPSDCGRLVKTLPPEGKGQSVASMVSSKLSSKPKERSPNEKGGNSGRSRLGSLPKITSMELTNRNLVASSTRVSGHRDSITRSIDSAVISEMV